MFREGFVLVNQIHDAIHAFVPEDDYERPAQRMKEIMEETMHQFLPRASNAPVKVHVSKYWE
jgi:DNA polymerase I-like protein with 3'-5' exonuclease and polymerase domains